MKHLNYTLYISALFLCFCVAALASDRIFTIAVIPDTQNYVDFDHQTETGFPFDARELFFEQMRYVAGHTTNNGGDIAFATALGDMWQHSTLLIDPVHEARGFRRAPNPLLDIEYAPSPKTRTIEIPTIRKGYELIAGKVPFSVVPGNHDYDAQWTDANHPPQPERNDELRYGIIHSGGLTNFRSVFSDQSPFFKNRGWYVASHDGGADSAQIFTAGGYRFLHIGLQFDPPNASLAWAASVIRRFPGLPTVISTHNYLDPSGERLAGAGNDNSVTDREDNNPLMVWDKFISQHDQIFMVLCGHRTTHGVRVEPNRFGHKVYQILSDYQTRWHVAKEAGMKERGKGVGDGWMRLMTFDMSGSIPIIRVRTYSDHYKKLSSEMPEYAAWYKVEENPRLSDTEFLAQDEFDISLSDFRARFGKPMESSKPARH